MGRSVEDIVYAVQRKIILKTADKGPCVVIGRNADFILKDRDFVLNVFIHGDIHKKIKRICPLYNVEEQTAVKMMADTDKRRMTNYYFCTDQKWGKESNYIVSLAFLADKTVRTFMEARGYCCENYACCINKLISKLRSKNDFPHEIGLFLGYPLEDVKGFVENKAGCSKCSGCWKVYGNEQETMELFEKYQKCASMYYARWKSGMAIERLAVNSKIQLHKG